GSLKPGRHSKVKRGSATRKTPRAVVLHVAKKTGAEANRREESRLQEAIALTAAIRLEVAASVIANIARATPATLIGSGKVDELKALCQSVEAEVVIVNASLS